MKARAQSESQGTRKGMPLPYTSAPTKLPEMVETTLAVALALALSRPIQPFASFANTVNRIVGWASLFILKCNILVLFQIHWRSAQVFQ